MLWNLSSEKRENISSVDTAWLRMDRRTNLMMIVGVLMFETPLDLPRFKVALEERFLKYERFKQRPVSSGSSHSWETDSYFDLDNHISIAALPRPATESELQEFVSELTSESLDPNKPLWHFHVVNDFQGGSALVVRIHHCYADGIALIQVLLGMTDDQAKPSSKPAKKLRAAESQHDGEQDFWSRFYRPFTGAVTTAVKTYWDVLEGTIDLVKKPSKLVGYTNLGVGVTADLAKVLTMPNDPQTSFKGKLGVRKKAVWAEPLDLDEVKQIGKALDCTVNDVLLSSVAGSLRNYLIERGENVDGLEVRALVPVNMRPEHKMDRLGNYFGLVFLPLPIGIANPFARLYEVKRRMEELKNSHEAILALGLLGVAGTLPNVVQQFSFDMLTKKASAVMTNVPGPRQPMYMAGSKVSDILFWVPSSGEIGMGVSILSYNGQIRFGLITDTNLVPDPENIVNRLQPEFDKLVYGTLLDLGSGPVVPESIEQEINQWISAQNLVES